MDCAPERALRACKTNCGAFVTAIETRAAVRTSKLANRIPPIAGG